MIGVVGRIAVLVENPVHGELLSVHPHGADSAPSRNPRRHVKDEGVFIHGR